MAGFRAACAAAVTVSGVLLGAVACGGSSTVSAPTTAVDGDGGASSGPTSLPATAPDSSEPPSGYPGSSSAAAAGLSAKDKAFVSKMRQLGLKAPDDVLVNAAQYTCESDKTNPKSESLDPIVTGSISPWEADAKAASEAAKKFIAEARASYCKA